MHNINALLNHYGYIVLFIALTLELIAVPLPGEVLMTYCGFLVFQGKLNLAISSIIAALGAITGITISYWIGRSLGVAFFSKHGSYIHLGPKMMEQTSIWFERYGSNLLVIAYFIPGVRHVTGYFSGISKGDFKAFAQKAYIGAFIWASTFIYLGKVLGPNWDKFHIYIKKYSIIGGLILSIILIGIYFYRNHKIQIMVFTSSLLNKGLNVFHSMGRMKIVVAGIALVCLGLTTFVIGLIQDYLANEFTQFDTIITLLVKLIFINQGSTLMELFIQFGHPIVFIPFSIVITIWVLVKGKDKWLEIKSLILVIIGGEFLEIALRYIFHREGPLGNGLVGNIKYTFPSEEALMCLVTYGFAAFIIIRHLRKVWLSTILSSIALVVCILVGICVIFLQINYPSDVIAGYAFGGVWLTLNIVILEVFRILPKINYGVI